jgi:hypothetical protein
MTLLSGRRLCAFQPTPSAAGQARPCRSGDRHGLPSGLNRRAVIAAGHNAVVTAHDAEKVADLAVDNADRVLAVSRLRIRPRPSVVKPVRRRSVLEKREYGDDPTMDGCSRDAQLGEDRVHVLLNCRFG